MFLGIEKRKIIDVIAIEGGRPEQSHEILGAVFLEEDGSQIVRNMSEGKTIDYYNITINPGTFVADLRQVSLRPGPRTSVPGREIAEIEAGGLIVGSAEVDP